MLYVGVLSGTSIDAIDVALVTFKEENPRLLATLEYPIPSDFKKRCLALTQSSQCSIDEVCGLNIQAGSLFAEAVLALLKKSNTNPQDIQAIGSHGQTLRHRPDYLPPFTLQIGDPSTIAEKTGITTIADFRSRDVAAGGQGAPLAPGFHAGVFRSSSKNRVILNIGGISNITLLPADPKVPISGFDTGPGNCLLDGWILQHLRKSFDHNGAWASTGVVQQNLLQHCLSDAYFSMSPPKSTGREYFNQNWLMEKMKASLTVNVSIEDIQATLLALTVHSIAKEITQYAAKNAEVFVCGGGAHNQFLIESLAAILSCPIESTAVIGIDPNWVEAMLFAWLAKQTFEGKPGNCPSVTGAKDERILGGIYSK